MVQQIEMNKRFILSFFALLSISCFGQNHVNVQKTIEDLGLWSSNVIPLDSDSNCSTFIIRIEKKVKPHYHEYHTETLYVVKGEGKMKLGNKTIHIREGDYINIPPKTVHSVIVTSMDWLEVISIQSPEFKGKDRVWVKEKDLEEESP